MRLFAMTNVATEMSFWGRTSPGSCARRGARLDSPMVLAIACTRPRGSSWLFCVQRDVSLAKLPSLISGGSGELKEIVKTVRFAGQEFEYVGAYMYFTALLP